MTEKFDFEKARADLKAGKPITGKDSVLGPLVKQLTEAALEAEVNTHLAQEVAPNRKKRKMPIQNCNLTLSQLAIFLEGRLDDALEL